MNRQRLNWTNLLFVSASHLVAVAAVLYLALVHFSWWTVLFGLLWIALCGVSITGGYHRLFSHQTYRAGTALRVFYLLFGAASVQNSALAWSAAHRAHHAHTDRDRDPYNIQRGFWWAHIGWVVCRPHDDDGSLTNVGDLEADPLVRLQHRYYVPLAIVFGALLPAAIGLLWGDPIGALLVAGWLRLVLQWHATFSVNSFAHWIGRRPYCRTSTARDSMLVALMTMGEGYHNFHHRFQFDYRNGIRWYHFDPTKWWIWSAARLGLATGLRRVPAERVARAREAVRLEARS